MKCKSLKYNISLYYNKTKGYEELFRAVDLPLMKDKKAIWLICRIEKIFFEADREECITTCYSVCTKSLKMLHHRNYKQALKYLSPYLLQYIRGNRSLYL